MKYLGIVEDTHPMGQRMWADIVHWFEQSGQPWPEGMCRMDWSVLTSRVEAGTLDKVPSYHALAKRWKVSPGKVRRIIERDAECASRGVVP